jgi:hypothetical protein
LQLLLITLLIFLYPINTGILGMMGLNTLSFEKAWTLLRDDFDIINRVLLVL